jgi:small subunit ribosomal protein S1
MQPEQKRISLSMKEVEPEEVREEAEQFENPQSTGLNVTLGDVYPELRKLK